MIRLGGPVFDAPADPGALARKHRELGYRAAYCPEASLSDAGRIAALKEAFAREDVVIAEVGAWCNLITPDDARRKERFDYVCAQLALADGIGALCCVDYLGTVAPDADWGPHPGNLDEAGFDLAVRTVRAIVDAVRPKRARFALEMMQWCIPDSVEVYGRLVRAVDRKAFAVHLDPVNIIVSPRAYLDTGAVIRECFARLGPWIASCHAKDLRARAELALHFDEVRPGLGVLDYRAYLTELDRLPSPPPLMLEHLSSAQEYAEARGYLFGLAAELGVAF